MSNPYFDTTPLSPNGTGANQIDTDLQLINRALSNLANILAGFVSGNTVVLMGTTVEKNAFTLPRTGLLFYDSTLARLQVNTGTPVSPVWVNA